MNRPSHPIVLDSASAPSTSSGRPSVVVEVVPVPVPAAREMPAHGNELPPGTWHGGSNELPPGTWHGGSNELPPGTWHAR